MMPDYSYGCGPVTVTRPDGTTETLPAYTPAERQAVIRGSSWPLKQPSPIKHGTHYAYTNRGCRCDVCVEGRRERERALRRAQRERVRAQGQDPNCCVEPSKCGTTTTYSHGCRCQPCRDAQAEYKRACRARQAVAA